MNSKTIGSSAVPTEGVARGEGAANVVTGEGGSHEASERLMDMLIVAAKAAVAYDNAIRQCANDPRRMASFCSAEGEDLDALYADWMMKSRWALTACGVDP